MVYPGYLVVLLPVSMSVDEDCLAMFIFNYAPFKEEGVYCFANVGPLVGRSVDKPCPINN